MEASAITKQKNLIYDVDEKKDLNYMDDGSDLHNLDLYGPKDSTEALPVACAFAIHEDLCVIQKIFLCILLYPAQRTEYLLHDLGAERGEGDREVGTIASARQAKGEDRMIPSFLDSDKVLFRL